MALQLSERVLAGEAQDLCRGAWNAQRRQDRLNSGHCGVRAHTFSLG